MQAEDYIDEAEGLPPLSDEAPDEAFRASYEEHRRRIGDILLALKDGDKKVEGFILRAGMMDPKRSVVSERVMEFCRLPYRTAEGVIPSCPGVLGDWKGCPPHSPTVAETIGLLSRGRCFLIVQFEGREAHNRQRGVHFFISRAAKALKKSGYAVLETYASGPCRSCVRGCDDGQDCRLPERRLFALEACGIWVNRLCREAAKFPILNGGPPEVRWIKDWNLPTQDTEAVRFVTGILLG